MKKRTHEKIVFLMKVSFLQIVIIVLFFTLAKANEGNSQEVLNKRVTVHVKDGTIREVLQKIEKEASIKFLYYSQLINESELISFDANKEKLGNILNKLLGAKKIKYEVDGNQIILSKSTASISQPSGIESKDSKNFFTQISGQVLMEDNEPLPGVNIVVKGTTSGTISDAEGRYSLEVSDMEGTLVFSFIGYTMKEVPIGGRTEINVTMFPDIQNLGEVVVVGYGTQKKLDVISSISTVDAKNLPTLATPNFEAGLQGMAAGVSVQSQSGAPGAPVRVLIRGTGSINLSTDPLYIIDGMPISMGASGLGSSNQSPMSLINQNDIESIDILKDAAATSIYGSRGSNGVIIVTTKSGKKGDGAVAVNYSSGFSKLTRTPADVGYANTQEWFQIMDQAYANSNVSFPDDMSEYYNNVPLANTVLASPKLTRQEAESIDTDWYNELFDLGHFQDVNLSTSKGTDQTSFFLSANYRGDNGVQNNNNLNRLSVRSNLEFKPTKRLTISSKMTFGYTRNNQRSSGITSIAVDALPWFPVRELDNPGRYFNAYTGSNPVAVRDPNNLLDQVEQYRGLGGLFIGYELPFIKGLTLRSEISGDVMQSNRVVWQGGDIRADATNTSPQSAASEEAITFTSTNYNLYGNYDRVFDKHSFSVVGGAEATRSFQYIRTVYGTGLTGKYQEIGLPTNLISIRGQKEYERYLFGYFGRFNYKFNNRYLAGVSLRRDGSSVFTEENRWGTFVALSAGWILSDEVFMSFLNGNTFLKIRGSYGETGNQGIPPNLNVVQYNNNPVIYGSSLIQGVNGTVPVNIGVTNLQWETTRSSDIGIDYGFFNDRISGSVAYYNRYVKGLLLQAGLPYSTGVSSPNDLIIGQGSYDKLSTIWGNFGDIVNSGFELDLQAINMDKSGFKWTTSINLGLNKNEIKSLTQDIDQSGGGLENVYGNAISRKGDRRAVWYIADYAGVDPQTGVPMIYALDQEAFDQDGSTQRLRNNVGEDLLLPATITNIRANRFYQDGKSGDPKYQGGITNTFQYKGFDFSFMFVFSGGNYILDYDRQQSTIVNPTRAILAEVYEKSWKESGDVAEYPEMRARFTYRVNNQNTAGFSGSESYHNGFLYKGDFIRLRNLQVGYSLPTATLERIHLKTLRVYATGANLFTLTKYPGFDPEGAGTASAPGFIYYANSIPQLRTITLGVEVKF